MIYSKRHGRNGGKRRKRRGRGMKILNALIKAFESIYFTSLLLIAAILYVKGNVEAAMFWILVLIYFRLREVAAKP